MTHTSSTFIRAAEVWLPTPDGSMLEFGSGTFGAALRFGAISRMMCFGRGEGLPGRAWDEGRPILLRDFEGTYFVRAAAAKAAGLTCAMAWPLFLDGALTSVLVIFCGHVAGPSGALELWRHDARVTTDMTLVGGAYGTDAQDLAAASMQTYLPRGVGLPGLAWQRGEAVFVDDLQAAPGRFLRADEAALAGLIRGLAIPVGSDLADSHVATFLASAELPLARRIERWVADPARGFLRRVYTFGEMHGGTSSAEDQIPIGSQPAGSIGKAWASGVPCIHEPPAHEPGPPAAAATNSGASAIVAIPVLWGGVVAEVVALYL